jgi:hypothetical protein
MTVLFYCKKKQSKQGVKRKVFCLHIAALQYMAQWKSISDQLRFSDSNDA